MSRRDVPTDLVLAEIHSLSQRPFQTELARTLQCAPSADALAEFAEKHPDRWAQCLAILGRLAGYKDQTRIQHDISVTVQTMADAELQAELESLRAQIESVEGDARTIDTADPAEQTAQNTDENTAPEPDSADVERLAVLNQNSVPVRQRR